MDRNTDNPIAIDLLGPPPVAADLLLRLRRGTVSRDALFLILNLVFWLSFMLLSISMVVLFKPTSPITLPLILLRLAIGFLITFGMSYIYHHPIINRLHGTSLWVSCFGVCVVISIFEGFIYQIDNLYWRIQAASAIGGGAVKMSFGVA